MNYTLERDGKTATVESPRELTPEELSTISGQHFGAAQQKAPSKPAYSDDYSPFVGGILDSLGLTKRPGARTAAGVILNPESLPEHAASLAVQAPLIAAGGGAGALAKAPAVLGRVATAAGLGAAGAAQKGESMTLRALLDATVAGLTEGAGKLVTSAPRFGLKALGAPARGYEWATEAPEKALELIRSRLPKVKFEVPSIGGGKLSIDDAVKKLSTLTGEAYEMARGELADAISRAEALRVQMSGAAKPLGPKAGSVFKHFTSKERFEPPLKAKAAEGARRAIDSNAGSAAADAATTTDLEGMPAGIYPLAMAPETFKGFARRVGVPLP